MAENKLISKSFLWMFIGLLVTFITGFLVANSEVMLENVFGGLQWILIIIELAIVIFLSARIFKMSPVTAKISFLLYSFVSGLTFSSIFVAFNLDAVIMVFLVSALIFGIMSFIGYITKIDLTGIGFYALMALIGVIIVSFINIFMHNSTLDLILSIISIIIFIVITAYDVQKIIALESSSLPKENLAIYGALDLYLDFINIFLNLLSIFGRSDD